MFHVKHFGTIENNRAPAAQTSSCNTGPPGEAPIKGFLRLRHIHDDFRRRKTFSVFLPELFAKRDEICRAHPVDITQRAAGEGREAEADDRADVRLARV